MNCPKCGKEIEAGLPFCGECGFRINQMPQASQMNPTPQSPLAGQAFQGNQVPRMNQAAWPGYVPQMSQASQEAQMNWSPQTGYAPSASRIPQQKKNNTALIVILILLGVLLVVGIIGFVLIFGTIAGGDSDRTGSNSVYERDDEEKEDNDDPVTTPPETVVQTPEEPAATQETVTAEYEHTIMVYLLGSDLEHNNGFATMDIHEMVAADYEGNTRIVIQTGGCLDWQLDGITGGEVERWELSGGTLHKLESLGQTRMLTPEALADFIVFSTEAYPAEKYTLVMWDHGGGVPIGYGVDEIYPNDFLYDYQIGEALAMAGVQFECVVFDACNMCTLEVAMSLKDYAEYMVAAESTVVGYGMEYTSWLNYVGSEGSDLEDSYELMAAAYMDSVKSQAASISLIELDKIQAVYDAYVDYVVSVHDDILNGGYEEYKLARANSGLYSGTESVDLITLVNTYSTEASSALMNATVNAVHYTESDYAYGHGLAVYSPNEYISYYDDARANMEALGYDEELLAFYDDVVTLGLSYLGTDYVNAYAGNWYNEELVYAYTGEGAGGYEPQESSLEITQMDGYQAIALSADDWSIVSDVEVSLFAMNQEQTMALVLGADNTFSTDANGYIIVEQPEYWTFVNGNEACFITTDYWENPETGEWAQSGAVCATLNGEPIMILTYYDEEHPAGVIQGYCYYDFNTGEGEFATLQFGEDDIVEIVLPYYYWDSDDNMQTGYINLSEESYYASELYLDYDYIDLSGTVVCVQYEITDVYENVYSTDWVEFY